MERVPIQSSMLRSVHYDAKSMTLEIEFLNGNVYQYFDVPETVHAELMQTDSHGKFVNTQIKGHYRYAKL